MTKKEFYIIILIVVYTYFVIIFQINVNNFIASQKNPNNNKMSFNAFSR